MLMTTLPVFCPVSTYPDVPHYQQGFYSAAMTRTGRECELTRKREVGRHLFGAGVGLPEKFFPRVRLGPGGADQNSSQWCLRRRHVHAILACVLARPQSPRFPLEGFRRRPLADDGSPFTRRGIPDMKIALVAQHSSPVPGTADTTASGAA